MDPHGTKACVSDFNQGDSEGTELVWSLRILLIRNPNLEITTNPAFNKFRTHHNFTEKRSHFRPPVKQAEKLSHGFRTCLSRRAASISSKRHTGIRGEVPSPCRERKARSCFAPSTLFSTLSLP